MKGEIDERGILLIRRDRGRVPQRCYRFDRECGDRCPHLDGSDPKLIRLTCGAVDVVIDK